MLKLDIKTSPDTSKDDLIWIVRLAKAFSNSHTLEPMHFWKIPENHIPYRVTIESDEELEVEVSFMKILIEAKRYIESSGNGLYLSISPFNFLEYQMMINNDDLNALKLEWDKGFENQKKTEIETFEELLDDITKYTRT